MLSLGMSWDEYWFGDVGIVKKYFEAEKLRQERVNNEAWLNGIYTLSALQATVGNLFKEKNDKPFEYCNYLFYIHSETKTAIRVGYDYPLFGNRNNIFEICYAKIGYQWWTDITPNFSQTCWKEVSDWYELKNGKYIKK